ncbi:thiamine-phosphate pyrophosphorylase [Pontibacillus chungwhensis BH030062]|uniref:Thiamine-phosphate synthase n=1 Tax=Pontibacillus chungwhensis BH030062 TaxID=1385513 RepID=A0A0A2VF53_9BACI|nr:thiamine phosphate synthase [Pontibacillus chungwhensis]KGP92265.1 thiamine-phosphate pyrophosphorylase [Pontibacillus chungwhensis BH030062]
MKAQIKSLLKLYFIMGSQDCQRNPRDILLEAIQGGITCFQYREKGPHSLKGDQKIQLAKDLQFICQEYQIPFIVNDDVDLALRIKADGIHVGQDDSDIREVVNRCSGLMIGLSITSLEEALSSPFDSIDYIGVGPIYQTSTKIDAKTPIGLTGLTKIRKEVHDFPIVAIGGIHSGNLKDVFEAGADGGSFISAITAHPNGTHAAKQLYNATL